MTTTTAEQKFLVKKKTVIDFKMDGKAIEVIQILSKKFKVRFSMSYNYKAGNWRVTVLGKGFNDRQIAKAIADASLLVIKALDNKNEFDLNIK
jgi:predicted DNA-binding protein (MmcQ/YjbR family)